MGDTGGSTERDELRRVMPVLDEDAADELADALAHSRFRAERFGKQVDVKVDRYIVRRELGRGGMGVVFEAYDPALMIPVALKLLRQAGEAGAGSAADLRLQREAQALASVEGDHVVRVYSAGFYKRQPWIAMQFVAGPDLHAWLRYRRERGALGWREVLAKFVDAARGLASIHLAGLIHRDFKPQNAVVDPRGRVRVLDFGLATHDRRPVVPGTQAAAHLRGQGVSSTVALVGTARYAAPEQFSSTDLDHRSDQFSLCVALHEALWGTTPFGDAVSTGQQLAATAGAATIPRPPASDVPGWLIAAVLRGLAYRPADRFPDMAALLHELTRDRRRGYRRAGLLLGGGLLGGLAVAAGLREPDRAAICAAQADGVDALRADAPASAAPAIDRWLAAWRTSHRLACVDTYTLARAPETLLARRQECLAGERARLAALLARAGDPALDGKLPAAVAELPPPANCLDEGLGRVVAPRDPDTRMRVHAVDAALAEAHAERMLGDYFAAVEHARRAVVAADASGHRPALARAHLVLGELERLRGRGEASAAALEAASAEAGLAQDLALQVRAEHELVRLALLAGHLPESADGHLQHAAATLAALPADEQGGLPLTRFGVDYAWAEHADMRGLLRYHGRRYDEAVQAHSEALARWTALAQHADLRRELAASLLDRGRAHSDDLQPAAALHDYREALRLELALLGPDHPALAVDLRNIAIELRGMSDLEGALEAARRALQLDTRHHGARSAEVAIDHTLLAAIHQDRGALGLARDHARAAVAAAGGDGPAEARADADFMLAGVALLQDASDADALLRRAAAAYRRIAGPEAACQQALVHVYRGALAEQRGRLDDAGDAAAAADAALTEVTGDGCDATGQLLWLRGRLAAVRGRADDAAALFTAGLDATAANAPARADMLVDLARVERQRGADSGRVAALVHAAQAQYRDRGLLDQVRALDEFLAGSPAQAKRDE